MATILLVDDDIEVLMINKKYFEQAGYSVYTADSADSAFVRLETVAVDCILLDVMMPGTSGFEAVERLKELSKGAPIIFLTGLTSEDDKVTGLLSGADDYVEKPYSLKELEARVQLQLRKKVNVKPTSTILNIPPLKIDKVAHKVYYKETEISLSNREYELLFMLASQANTLVSFDAIATQFFGMCSDSDRRTVMVTASRMRKKIEDYTGLDNIIETVYSKGYILRTRGK